MTAAEKFQKHVEQICAEHHVVLSHHLTKDGSPYSVKFPTKRVGLHHVVDAKTYAEALHEVGHLVADGAFMNEGEPGIELLIKARLATHEDAVAALAQEERAWAWAQEHALAWTAEMSAHREWALDTYRLGLTRAPHTVDAMAAFVVVSAAPESSAAGRMLLPIADRKLRRDGYAHIAELAQSLRAKAQSWQGRVAA